MGATTTVYIDAGTEILIVRDRERGAVLELTSGAERVCIVAPGSWELGRVAASVLDEVCDPRVLDDDGEVT